MNATEELLSKLSMTKEEKRLADKIFEGQRLTEEEGLFLYEKASTDFLSLMANYVKERISGNKVYFNINIHIEPTNYCIYNCKFCSYARKLRDPDGWAYTMEEILEMVGKYKNSPITEVHITGGVYPHYDVHTYGKLIRRIKEVLPQVHVKAFTAVELEFMIRKAKIPLEEGLKKLKEYGLDSLPGGGAEILNDEIAKALHDKSKPDVWLKIHRIAHKLGIPSNATMLYGHVEKYHHRVEHLSKLRALQDETGGFNAFIPLKYRSANNKLGYVGETTILDDMRNYAVSRIFLDNIPHLKAYWVNIGKKNAQMSLAFGVDDLDGTIDDTTKIYTMAGAEEQHPRMTVSEMVDMIQKANRQPVERDSVYNELKIY